MLLARDCTLINLTRQFSTRYRIQVNYVHVPSRQADYQNNYFWSTETWNWSWLLNQWPWRTFEMWGLLSGFCQPRTKEEVGGGGGGVLDPAAGGVDRGDTIQLRIGNREQANSHCIPEHSNNNLALAANLWHRWWPATVVKFNFLYYHASKKRKLNQSSTSA